MIGHLLHNEYSCHVYAILSLNVRLVYTTFEVVNNLF